MICKQKRITSRMVWSIYRRFSESTNFCSKKRLIRPVAMMLGYVKNRQPVLFHSNPGLHAQYHYNCLLFNYHDVWVINVKVILVYFHTCLHKQTNYNEATHISFIMWTMVQCLCHIWQQYVCYCSNGRHIIYTTYIYYLT